MLTYFIDSIWYQLFIYKIDNNIYINPAWIELTTSPIFCMLVCSMLIFCCYKTLKPLLTLCVWLFITYCIVFTLLCSIINQKDLQMNGLSFNDTYRIKFDI
jgi:hypothetical protein